MLKFLVKKFAICFGLILASGIISYLLGCFLISPLFGSSFVKSDLMTLNIGFSVVKGIACSVALHFFIYSSSKECEYADPVKTPYFYDRLQKRKKIRAVWIFLILLVLLAVAAVCIVFLIKYNAFCKSAYEYKYSVKYSEIQTSEKDVQFQIAYLLCRVLPAMAVTAIAVWIGEMRLTAARTCFKCGCYLSRQYSSTLSHHVFDNTEYKDVERKEKVGDVYRKNDNKKVGTVYTKKKESLSRNVKGVTKKQESCCVYCNKEHTSYDVDVFVDRWK